MTDKERIAVTPTDEVERALALERKLQEHHGVDLAAVLEIIGYLRDPGDTVLVGGSLAYGLGNGRSDLDIVVAGPGTGESSSRMPLEHFLQGLRVDVWKMQAREIDELFVRAEEHLASGAPFAGAFGTVSEQADLKLLHRLAYGVVLDGPPLQPRAARGYRAVAGDVVAREYAERMRDAALTAQLALRAGQMLPAATSARFAVEDALQTAIAMRELPFCDNKWLQTRMLGDLPQLWPTYAPFRVLPERDEDVPAFVESALATCSRLTGLDIEFVELAGEVTWSVGDLRCMKVGSGHLLVSPHHGVVWELDEAEAGAWTGLAAGEPLGAGDEGRLRLGFALQAQGVVALRWSAGIPIEALRIETAVSA